MQGAEGQVEEKILAAKAVLKKVKKMRTMKETRVMKIVVDDIPQKLHEMINADDAVEIGEYVGSDYDQRSS